MTRNRFDNGGGAFVSAGSGAELVLNKENKMKIVLISIFSIIMACNYNIYNKKYYSIEIANLHHSSYRYHLTIDSLIIIHYEYNPVTQEHTLHQDFKKIFNTEEKIIIQKLFDGLDFNNLKEKYYHKHYSEKYQPVFYFEITFNDRTKKVKTLVCYLKQFSNIVDFIMKQTKNEYKIYYFTELNDHTDPPCDCLDYKIE